MISLLVIGFAVIVALALLAIRWRFAFILLLTCVLLLQNLAIMMVLRMGGATPDDGRALLLVKEFLFAAGFASLAAGLLARASRTHHIRLNAAERWILVYFLFLMIPFLWSQAPSLVARVAGLRSLALLPGLFLIGRWLRLPSSQLAAAYKLLVFAAVALALFGLVEAYVLPDAFWLSVGHEEYYLMKRGRPVQGTLYGNMRFWIGEQPIRRVASLTGDPLISSYVIAFPLALFAAFTALYRSLRTHHLVAGVLLGTATLLTLSRGAVLVVFLAAVLAFFCRARTTRFAVLTALGFISALVVALSFGDALLEVTYGKGHLIQLRRGLEVGLQHPFGIGTGTATGVVGAIVAATGVSGTTGIAGDSFVGSVATQTGIVGLLLFAIVMVMIALDVFQKGANGVQDARPEAWLFIGTATFLAGLLAISTVNEAGYGYIATGLVFLFAGILSRHADGWETQYAHSAQMKKRRGRPLEVTSL